MIYVSKSSGFLPILKNGKVLGFNLLLHNQYTPRPHRLIFYR